jgi:Tfp pilus assembly protein PilE
MKRTQSGITLVGFLIVLAVAGFFAYVGMKLFPMYSEFYSVKTALRGLASEPGIAMQDPAKIQDLFFRRLYISYSDNVKPENVKLTRGDRGWKMEVNYEVRRPMIYNIDVVGKFNAVQDLTRTGDVDG